MQTVKVWNATRGTVLGEQVGVADTSVRRMIGLLGRRSLDAGAGLLILPSQAVHTIGMRFPIDVVFVDRLCHVSSLTSSLAPNRLSGLHWRARYVLELPVGAIAQSGTAIGDEVRVEDPS
jgi:uncharacterized membrane protein (UPF0127 family)